MGWTVALAAIAGGLTLSPDVRALAGGAMRQLTWGAVWATVPLQIAGTALCGVSLALFTPGASMRASLMSRALRDAANDLLVFLPGMGELIGTRSLVLTGSTARAAVAGTAMDLIAQAVAQVPFVLLALSALPLMVGQWRPDGDTLRHVAVAVALLAVVGAALAALRRHAHWASPLAQFAAVVRRRWAEVTEEWRGRRGAMPAAIGLHLLAWLTGGLQVWVAARVLGIDLSLFNAVVVQSAAYAVRSVLFVVPAGVGVQEAGFVVAGAALGLGEQQALALSLVLRARDLVLGVPTLIAWPAFEWRYRGQSRATKRSASLIAAGTKRGRLSRGS